MCMNLRVAQRTLIGRRLWSMDGMGIRNVVRMSESHGGEEFYFFISALYYNTENSNSAVTKMKCSSAHKLQE